MAFFCGRGAGGTAVEPPFSSVDGLQGDAVCTIGRMKKVKRQTQRPSATSKSARGDVASYLAKVPKPARSAFTKLRAIVRSAVPPDATEGISYGILAFRQKKVLLWLGAFSSHCSLFPTAEIIQDFKDHLKGYTVSKGTIQFPLDKPLPATLIKDIVKARVARNQE